VLLELKKHNIPFPKEFVVLIKTESGNYKSKLTTEYNNLTGMRHPGKRQTLSKGKNKYGYATYPSWRCSIKDLKLFIDFSPPKQNECFKMFLKRRG